MFLAGLILGFLSGFVLCLYLLISAEKGIKLW